jgi:hypothetical protein
VADVARRGLEVVEVEVNALDEKVGGDDRLEACALAEDGGVVADAEDEGCGMWDVG